MSERLKSEVERIVEQGEDVQRKVRDAVEDAAKEAKATSQRLVELSRDAMDGAVAAVERSTPADPESTLRQVVDGLGEGLHRTAQATRLAVEEAASDGRAFAEDDLKNMAADLRTAAGLFVDTIESSVRKTAKGIGAEASSLREHAERTLESIRPSLTSAADAAAKDPIGFATESAGAAVKFTREGAGALFSAVGGLLESAGDRLKGKPEDTAESRSD